MAEINTSIWGPLRDSTGWKTVLGEDIKFTQTVDTTLSTGNDKHQPLDNSVCIFGFGSTSPAVNAQVITCDFNTDTKTTRNLYPNRTSVPWAMAWTDGPSYDASEWQSGYANSYWGNNYRWLTASPQGMWEEEYLGDRAKPLYFLTNDFDYQRKWLVLVKPIVLTPKTVQEGGDTIEYKRGRAYGGFTTLKNWYDNVKDVYDGICQVIMAPTTFSNDIPTNSGGLNFSLFAEIEDEINVEYQEGHPKYNQQKIDGQFYAYKTYIGPYTTFDGSNYLNGYMTIAGGYNVRNDGDWNRTPWTVLYMPTVGDWNSYMINSTGDQDDYGWGFFAAYNPGNKTYNQVEDEIAKVAAHMGTFFIFDLADKNKENDDINVFLGLLDENAISTGEYSRGMANRNSDQFDWDNASDADYDPSYNPDPPGPEPDPNPIEPETPGFTLAVDSGSVCYVITKAEWNQIWNDIYGGSKSNWKDLIDGLALYGANPLNCILNYRWYPFEIPTDDTAALRLGSTVVQPDSHRYHKISSSDESFKSATATFWAGRAKNFVESKKTKCRVFLPFYGFYELPMSLMMKKELGVQFQYDLPNDTGIWFIMFGGSIYDWVECTPYIEIPITGDNSLQIAAAKAQRNLQIAMAVGGAVAGIAAGIGGLSAFAGMAADAGGLIGGLQSLPILASEAPLEAAAMIGGTTAAGASLARGAAKTASSVYNTALQVGTLSTNVPVHSAASDTTFLSLKMYPYVQFFQNDMQESYDAAGYKKSTGIACNCWKTIAEMDKDSLLKVSTPVLDDYSNMEASEIEALHAALVAGFYP